MRLTNAADQSKIRAALPDNVAGLASTLPSLRTGEAIVTGEAVPLPARVLVQRPEPEPAADDPSLSAWHESTKAPKLAKTIENWRSGFAS